MRILQVVHGLPPEQLAGTEIYCYELSKALSKIKDWKFQKKHQIFIFHRIITDNNPYKVIIKKLSSNLITIGINTPWHHFHKFESEYKNEKVDEIFKTYLMKINPDIVHIQHLIGLSSDIINIVKENKIPLVLHLHDFWYLCRRGQLIRQDMSICRDINLHECAGCFIKDEENKAEKVKKRQEHMFSLLKRPDLIISPSRFLKSIYNNNKIDNILYSDNGMNKSYFKNIKKKPSNKTRFGFIGTFIETKGVHVLIDAFKNLDNPNAKLHLYGFFPETALHYKEPIMKKIENSTNIHFHGRYHYKNITKVFSNIDCLVVPSLWYENSPLTIHEAYLCNTPVIASNIGGMAEYVKNNKTGLLFELGNTDDLRKKMDMFIRNKRKYDTHHIKIKDIKENAEEIQEIYKKFTR